MYIEDVAGDNLTGWNGWMDGVFSWTWSWSSSLDCNVSTGT
jgi:hypothetical protein